MQIDVAVNRDWCLANLVAQVEGRVIDNATDTYLIDQLNASYIGDTKEGYVTECQVGGCALRCLSTNEKGTFRLVERNGLNVCEQ